jgi:flavin-dependent thymidylate synthase
MKVSLIDYTGCGRNDPARWAAAVLIFTKSTRLEMKPDLFREILNKPLEEMEKELAYMANTIPSSWEFVHYTFMIEGVTRAFTHQLVRTRTASFAQQTMRVLNVQGWTYGTGPTVKDNDARCGLYDATMKAISNSYEALIKLGANIEDARGVLPTNIHTNIVMSLNLRTLVDLVRKRSSPRTQGEYRQFIEMMKEVVSLIHPWVHLFFSRTADAAMADLDREIADVQDKDKRTRMMKLVDQLRQNG